MASQLFRCKSIDQLMSDSENAEIKLKKSLGWLSLTSLGIGAVIGSGIFTVVGTAIAGQKLQVSSILNAPLLQYLIHAFHFFWTPRRGTRYRDFFRPGGDRVRICFGVLRRARGHDSDCRQRVHLHLRDDGGIDRVDYRLGPDPGICRLATWR